MEWWKIIIGVFVIGQLWIIYEFITAPTMPDDYDLSDEEEKIMKDIEAQKDEGNNRDN
jgi:hypothetical protein